MRARAEKLTGRTLEESYTGFTMNLLLAIQSVLEDEEDHSHSAKRRRTS